MIEITCYYDEEAEEYKLINRSLEKESMVVASDSKLFYALKSTYVIAAMKHCLEVKIKYGIQFQDYLEICILIC